MPRRNRSFAAVLLAIAVAVAVAYLNDFRPRPVRQPAPPAGAGRVVTGKVVSIADGDTLTVLDENRLQHKIRLFGIDAPERSQAFGARSREGLSAKVFGQSVRVEVVDVDRYGRQVGRVYCGDRDVNLEQVRDGLAWQYTQFDRSPEGAAAQAEARAARRGLWGDPRPQPPWEFRREQAAEAKRFGAGHL
jgi:endonuclease YncB( thermonuclease family)